VQKWWRSQPVFVTSFNGITAASFDDLKLADLDSRVPCTVRLLHSEMMQTKDRSPDFSAFRAAMLGLLIGSKLSVSVLLWLVWYVMQTRRRRGLKSTSFVGVLLIDELAQLSLLPPLSPPRRRRKRRSPDNEKPQQPTLSSSSGSPDDGAQCVFNAHVPTPGSTSSALHPGAGDRVDAQGAAVAVQTVEAARRAVCDIARAHRLCACITSLSDRFIRRQAATSSSVLVPIGTFQLVEAERVADAVRRMLISSDKGFQVTIRSDTISVLDTEVVAVCLGVLAGGHPRAAEILIEAIKTSRDGQTYLGRVLDTLEPDKLSLAGSSIDLLGGRGGAPPFPLPPPSDRRPRRRTPPCNWRRRRRRASAAEQSAAAPTADANFRTCSKVNTHTQVHTQFWPCLRRARGPERPEHVPQFPTLLLARQTQQSLLPKQCDHAHRQARVKALDQIILPSWHLSC